jgi:2-dehydro-3-deoxyphosphogalactonate aldolase
MNAVEQFRRRLSECPVVAIIRGVTPGEVEAIGEALFEGGIRIIEVPLNSPDPLRSIERLATALGDRATIGAGTVLDERQVAQVRDSGGQLIVSPGMSRPVIESTIAADLVSVPGVFTPTEAFAAIAAGAHALKLFPAEAASPAVVKAQRAVLPKNVPLIVVGGVTAESAPAWREAGADGFGLGSALFRPGQSPGQTRDKARNFIAAIGG